MRSIDALRRGDGQGGGEEGEEDHLSPGHPCQLAAAPTCWSEGPVDDWIESYFAFCGPSQWHALVSKKKYTCHHVIAAHSRHRGMLKLDFLNGFSLDLDSWKDWKIINKILNAERSICVRMFVHIL